MTIALGQNDFSQSRRVRSQHLLLHASDRQHALPVIYLGTAKDPYGNARAAFEAGMTINRKEFGLNWDRLETDVFLVGDDVQISLSIRAIAQ